MQNLLLLQVRALIWKNWIVLSKHWITAVLRCLLLPIGYGVFIGYAQAFLHRLNDYGMGSPASVLPLNRQVEGQGAFLWADETNGTSNLAPADIIARITSEFTPQQLETVRKLDGLDAIRASCPQNLNGMSPCFAGIGFTNSVTDTSTPATFSNIINYTIFADSGLSFIDPPHHDSDFEKRILPLQWSLDKAVIELRTGLEQKTPLEWAYTNTTNYEQKVKIRLSYVRGIREIIGLALFLCFVGISYQIPGSTVNERALLITTHMKVMGLLDSARILSWHISISITYLPAWIAVALTWKYLIFINTSAGLMVVIHLLLGLVLASWSFMTAAPFPSSPQLAAIISTFLAIVCALLGLVIKISKIAPMIFFVIFFPPSFYIYALRAICGYENRGIPINILKGDPDNGVVLFPLICISIVNIFLWPFFAVLLEQYLHEPQTQTLRRESASLMEKSSLFKSDAAISIRNLSKTYKPSVLGSKHSVVAIEDLSLDVPKSGIFVLLGSNGAGKSTTLSIIAGLTSMTSGAILYEGELGRPRRGVLGIVPQKNVLFPELTCLQTLRVWKSVKWSENSEEGEDLELLLRDCDLGHKIHANADTLSGGQKRKLQLAIGLLSGSKVVLVDECTSGVDPLSRRALWKTLLQYRGDRTIIFTTHFLDEADLLADHIAILTSPGKVVASGSPVELKHKYGQGYSIQVTFEENLSLHELSDRRRRILEEIHKIVALAYSTTTTSRLECYHLKTKDSVVVNKALQVIESEKQSGNISSYDLLGTTIEDVFMAVVDGPQVPDEETLLEFSSIGQAPDHSSNSDLEPKIALDLPSGRPVSSLHQARTIFYKRALILRRSWLTPLLAIVVAVVGSCVPLTFINGQHQYCAPQAHENFSPTRIYLPSSPLLSIAVPSSQKPLYASPPGIISTLGPSTDVLEVTYVPDNMTFMEAFTNDFHGISIGGVSVNLTTGESLVAWEASPPGHRALSTLNLASNILLNRALNSTGNAGPVPTLIQAEYVTFKKVAAATLVYLKWNFFFGALMSIYPAFSALYVVRERCSSVQAMQFSNGLTNPIGLWLGHLLFDSIFSTLLATIITVIFALVSDQFHGLGIVWLILALYGVTGHLFAYCLSHLASSPLGAFALVSSYQILTFLIYITSYMVIFTFGPIGSSSRLMTIVHFSTSFISPVTSVARAALVSVDLFSLGCDGTNYATRASLVSLTKLGGPILYLFLYILGLSAILYRLGSGSISMPFRCYLGMGKRRLLDVFPFNFPKVTADCNKRPSSAALLQVVGLSKSFSGNQVIDNVDIDVEKDATFALLGPNGAGKTTTFNIIRGDIKADAGDVFIGNHSIVTHRALARSSLGVCPQFTAIDPQLTVGEHLIIYGRLKGLQWGEELDRSIDMVLQGTSLSEYSGRMANKLSGGNQRKLSLAIALLGNPPVLLIDEFSSGVDPKMKREMWRTLRNVSKDKAIIITTHSMEEASALASCVGILAKRILALGSPESLARSHGMYEVHFSCPTPEEVVKARSLMAHVPGASMINDVATRFEVPLADDSTVSEEGSPSRCGVVSLASLYGILSANDHGSMEYTVEKASLESVFLKVIREHNIKEEDMVARNNTSTPEREGFC